MKDYRLSEIKKICEEYEYCGSCPLEYFCLDEFRYEPSNWNLKIDEKDGEEVE